MDENRIVSSSGVIDQNGVMDDLFLTDDLLFSSGKRTILGFDACKTNVLAERDDSVVKALCYDV